MPQVEILLYLDRMNKRLRHENGPAPKEESGGSLDGWEFDGVPVMQANSVDDIADILGPG